jgi:hypothetical protein
VTYLVLHQVISIFRTTIDIQLLEAVKEIVSPFIILPKLRNFKTTDKGVYSPWMQTGRSGVNVAIFSVVLMQIPL